MASRIQPAQLEKLLKAFLLLGFVVVLAFFAVSCRKKFPLFPRRAALPAPASKPSPREAPPPVFSPVPRNISAPPRVRAPKQMKVAIIIDDLGYSDQQARPFINAPFPLALAVLPELPYSSWVSREAAKAGKTVLLHVPLEPPQGYVKSLGPGGLFLKMTDPDLKETFEKDLATVPDASGVNNHMGSVGSRDPRVAEQVAEEAKAHRLFVIDSLTAPDSILYRQARKLGVPAAKRDIFLDNEVTEKSISIQFDDLMKAAREHGNALAIGHPHPETLAVLRKRVPELSAQNIEIVPVEDLLDH